MHVSTSRVEEGELIRVCWVEAMEPGEDMMRWRKRIVSMAINSKSKSCGRESIYGRIMAEKGQVFAEEGS